MWRELNSSNVNVPFPLVLANLKKRRKSASWASSSAYCWSEVGGNTKLGLLGGSLLKDAKGDAILKAAKERETLGVLVRVRVLVRVLVRVDYE